MFTLRNSQNAPAGRSTARSVSRRRDSLDKSRGEGASVAVTVASNEKTSKTQLINRIQPLVVKSMIKLFVRSQGKCLGRVDGIEVAESAFADLGAVAGERGKPFERLTPRS